MDFLFWASTFCGWLDFEGGGGGGGWGGIGIQNNLKIHGSTRVASSTNNVQPNKVKHVILFGNF